MFALSESPATTKNNILFMLVYDIAPPSMKKDDIMNKRLRVPMLLTQTCKTFCRNFISDAALGLQMWLKMATKIFEYISVY